MPLPSIVKLHKRSKVLELQYGAERFELPAEYLRVFSPSAEVRGHGGVGGSLPHGKLNVGIDAVTAQGNYAVKLTFDDGHDSGIYTWDYLYELGRDQAINWQTYLTQLNDAGLTRDPHESTVKFFGG